jgi:hypothetical protein
MPQTLQLTHLEDVYRQLSNPTNHTAPARAWRRDARSTGGDELLKLRLLFEVAGLSSFIQSIERDGTGTIRAAWSEGSEINPAVLQSVVQSLAPRSGFAVQRVSGNPPAPQHETGAADAEKPPSLWRKCVDRLATSNIRSIREIALTYQADRSTKAAVRAQKASEQGGENGRDRSEHRQGVTSTSERTPNGVAQYQQARYGAGAPRSAPTTRTASPDR